MYLCTVRSKAQGRSALVSRSTTTASSGTLNIGIEHHFVSTTVVPNWIRPYRRRCMSLCNGRVSCWPIALICDEVGELLSCDPFWVQLTLRFIGFQSSQRYVTLTSNLDTFQLCLLFLFVYGRTSPSTSAWTCLSQIAVMKYELMSVSSSAHQIHLSYW